MDNEIDNLKRLYKQIDNKELFAATVADYFGLKKGYVQRHYFQGKWLIPSERIPKIITIAQKTISARMKVLEDLQKTLNK